MDGIRFQVVPDRFILRTKQEIYDNVIRDLMLGTFGLLSHTPLKMLGINRSMHYRLKSREILDNVGDGLAPKESWSGIIEHPGMSSLSMVSEKHDFDHVSEILTVKIEPSQVVKDGLWIDVNDHYEIKEGQDSSGSDLLLQTLDERWQDSYNHSKDIIDKLLERLL